MRTSIHTRLIRGLLFIAALGLAACVEHRAPTETPTAPARAWGAVSLAELRAVAQEAPQHGLPEETEILAELDRLDDASRRDAAAATALDQKADGLFRLLANEFGQGAIDPQTADPNWAIARAAAPDVDAMLVSARASGGVATQLDGLLPSTPEYARLEAELWAVTAEPPDAVDASGLSREARLDHLRATLERWRWLPREMPARRIDVLPPLFEARLVGFAPPATHRVIVGARRMPTPTFQASIQSVTLNPSWTPPSSIVAAELLPRFRRNPSAAAAEGFEVLDRSGTAVDPSTVNWSARPFPYTLRQRPGPRNALGGVRFDFPNPYAIFLHDTPSRSLFERTDRTLSHGCMRVDQPVALAAAVLGDPAWTAETLQAAIDAGGTQVLPLTQPVPIFVLYVTAAVDETGAVQYGEDIYGRDRVLLNALDHRARVVLTAASLPQWQCSR